MDTLGIVSTGTLNYHLKVLGDLLAKNEQEQYTLTERGKLAAKLLTEFPEESNSQEKESGNDDSGLHLAVSSSDNSD